MSPGIQTRSLAALAGVPDLAGIWGPRLRAGETLTGFIEDAVRRAVERRRVERTFHARAEVAWQEYLRTGKTVPAEQLMDRLQSRLDARRKQLLGE